MTLVPRPSEGLWCSFRILFAMFDPSPVWILPTDGQTTGERLPTRMHAAELNGAHYRVYYFGNHISLARALRVGGGFSGLCAPSIHCLEDRK